MPSLSRMLLCCGVLILWTVHASAQYMRLTTDNPADNTRLRAGVTNIVTITLDTNHDRNGALQTCNSHTSTCGAPSTGQPLDMFSYTLAFRAVGGTVQWGEFTAADAAYTASVVQAQNDTEVEINQARPIGTVTNPGLSTLGTIPVTIVSGAPTILPQIGPGALNPFGFGNGFGTFCDAFDNANTYTLGNLSDPCGTATGHPGDWFDFDGVSTEGGTGGSSPMVMTAPANASGTEGVAITPITATATDPDAARTLTITQSGMPSDLTFTTDSPGPSQRSSTVSGTPGFSDAGIRDITFTVNDDIGSASASAVTRLTIANNEPVFVDVIPDATVSCGPVDRTAFALDNNSDPITFSFTGPPFTTLTPNPQHLTDRTATIHIAPGPTDPAGTFTATVTAFSLGSTYSRSFLITVIKGCAPELNSIADINVSSGGTLDRAITAQDADGDPLTFVIVSGSPPFMTVTTTDPGMGTATGNIHLAPGITDVGLFTAGVYVTDGSLSSFTRGFSIRVCDGCSGAPVLGFIVDMTVRPGSTLDQAVSGSDPDGDAITFTKDSGPTFMTVTTTSPITGNVHLAPAPGTTGNYFARVGASDGVVSATPRSFQIHMCATCVMPVFAPVSDMTVTEGTTADQAISATNPSGSLDFRKGVGPSFMTVSTTSPGTSATGNIHLAPGLGDVGTYIASVRVHNNALFTNQTFTITVLSGNRCPAAGPGGPYSGLTGVPIDFDGSASSDPEGSPLTYAWDFDASNGITVDATGPLASHTFAAAGTFTVTLTVADNGDGYPARICSHSATTTATITAACAATVFNGYDTIRLNSGKPTWYAYVQPKDGCYSNSDAIISSFVMKYAGHQISASGKTSVGGDKSGDGLAEIKVTFSKDDFRALFAGTGLLNGHNDVTVMLEAHLTSGGTLAGTTRLDVVNNGNFTAATVSPNPLNPEATLTYTTTRQGAVRVDLFDIQGRLVRRLVDEATLAAGTHDVTIDGKGSRGETLPSGVYYIRGTSSEGEFRKLVTILK